jgi:Zn-finger nucleic acid-binding protein
MQCPKCGSVFRHLKISVTPEYGGTALNNERGEGTIEVDQCLTCNGVWFGADDLNEYLNEKILLIDSPKAPKSNEYYRKSGPCPKCLKMMQLDVFKNIVVDRCATCQGVWLDGGLLGRVEVQTFSFGEKWRLFFDKLRQQRSEE